MEKSNWIHSNTSHVIVYPISFRESSSAGAYSNTSHVIVYPFLHSIHKEMIIFKYISCYCLSQDGRGSSSVCGKFKYISCYCLSRSRKVISGERIIQIHLMLLFIGVCLVQDAFVDQFKYISCYCLSASTRAWPEPTRIQIHLMLLFIGTVIFQWPATFKIQIHLMLLFI